MARQRDFGSTKKVDEYDDLNFTLNGTTFECRPAIQGSVLLKFVANANANDPSRAAEAVDMFFKTCLTEKSYADFTEMTESPDVIVEMEQLTEITQWLIEEYTDRPTRGSKA